MSGEPPGIDAARRDDVRTDRPRYLFAVDGEHASAILPLVCDLVADADGELVIANPVALPEQTPLSMPQPRREGERRTAQFAFKATRECRGDTAITQAVAVGDDRGSVLRGMVETHGISTVVTEAQPLSGPRLLLDAGGVDASFEDACDTILVSRTDRTTDIDSVLVPVARGPHSGMAIDVGVAVARQNDASLELLHVYPDGDDEARARGTEVIDRGTERIDPYDDVEASVLPVDDIEETIIERADAFDVTVLGAPCEGRLRQFVHGTVPDAVRADADATVLVAHRGNLEGSWLDRWVS